ncbi:TlpA family protein disulfide reductase [Verrucomicrobiales bacterium]|jgi:hypothetical protein|nr:TlpA family protein disulfide reductase [Verrucomicrobiales bacterium]
MPHLVQMSKRYGKKGLQVIGVHRQGGSDEKVIEKAKDLKMEFPVAKTGSGPVQARGIPHLFVFGATGKLVFSGHPMDKEAEKSIKRELKGVTAELDTGAKKGFGLAPRVNNLSEQRSWTNADGKAINAALVSIEGDSVKLEMPNGRKVSYPINKLSEQDQEFIESRKTAK